MCLPFQAAGLRAGGCQGATQGSCQLRFDSIHQHWQHGTVGCRTRIRRCARTQKSAKKNEREYMHAPAIHAHRPAQAIAMQSAVPTTSEWCRAHALRHLRACAMSASTTNVMHVTSQLLKKNGMLFTFTCLPRMSTRMSTTHMFDTHIYTHVHTHAYTPVLDACLYACPYTCRTNLPKTSLYTYLTRMPIQMPILI